MRHIRPLLALLAIIAIACAPTGAAFAAEGQPAPQEGAPYAAASIVEEGTCGTCSWSIDSSGKLLVWPTDGTAGKLDDVCSGGYWLDYSKDIKSAVIGKGVAAGGMARLFEDCSSLQSADLSGLDTSATTNMGGMFSGCEALESLDLTAFNTSATTYMGGMFYGCAALQSVEFPSGFGSACTDMPNMFQGCSSLKSLDLSAFDTSSTTDMGGMFGGCTSLKSLDLSGFNTSKVESMGGSSRLGMFYGCTSLRSIKFPAGFGSACTNMQGMFYGCTSLESLDLSSFKTSKVEYMGGNFTSNVESCGMFQNCSSLTSLNLASFNTSQVINMDSMFENCPSLTSIDISSFSTPRLATANRMFGGCSALSSLDLSSFDMSKVTNSDYMLSTGGYISVTVGSKFVFSGDALTLPTQYFAGCTGRWVSKADGRSYSAETIAVRRSKKPDTYTTEMQPVFRLSGGDRYKTMQAVVSAGFAYCSPVAVVLASGQNFPDALSASALAGMLHAPVVLTQKGTLTAEAAAEIDAFKPSTVYVVGGEAAVSTDVEDTLIVHNNVKVVRVAGADRVKTADAVCGQGAGSWGKVCIVAYSDSFADALSMAPFAYAAKAPVLLAEQGTHRLASSTLAEIGKCGFTGAVIAGGTAVVDPGVEAQLRSAGVKSVKRLGGADRYDTSRVIAEYAVAQGVLSYRGAAVATGRDFADALSAGAACGRGRSVLLLAADVQGGYKAIDGIIGAHAADVAYCRVIGGDAAVSYGIYSRIEQMMG